MTDQFLQDVIDISMEAGKRIMTVYDTNFDVTKKDDNSPLTEADMAAHNAIVAGLKRITPSIPILSEESAEVAYDIRRQWQRYWLVDPLDGTREFVKRNGEFTVNIALIENNAVILGVVYIPVSGVIYYAQHQQGAFKKLPDEAPVRLHTRHKPQDSTVVAGSRSHRGNSLEKFLARIGEYEIISMGSSLKSCLVAEGVADIYPRLGPTSEWDTAAAQCVVEEAGGLFVTTDMQPLRYNTKDSLLNPHFLVIGDPHFDWRQFLE